MSVFVTYQKGTRRLFLAAKRVLYPPRVEGVSLPPSVEQVQDKGKNPKHEEGPSGVLSGDQEAEFVLLQDYEMDAKPTNVEMGEIIKEQQSVIEKLSLAWIGPSGTCSI